MPAIVPPPAVAQPPRGLVARLVGVLAAPRTTYADVAAHPTWLGVLIVVLSIGVLSASWIVATEVGRAAVVDQQLQTLEAFGRTVTDEEYQRMLQLAPYSTYLVAAVQVVGLPLAAAAVAGIAFATFNGVLHHDGHDATFQQVFAIAMSSSVVSALRALCSTPLNYARESLSNPTTLGAVVPLFEDTTFGGRLFGSIDLFVTWWILNLAIGLAVLYKRRTAPIATTMLAGYAALGVANAAVRSALAGA